MRGFILFIAILFFPVLNAKTVLVGALIYNPPFETSADKNNHYFGFDIDLIREICKRIDADCEFKGLTFVQLFTELLAGNIDLAVGAISITPERQKTFLFSLPYFTSNGQYLTNTKSSINSTEDIRNKIVGIEQGTVFKDVTLAKFNKEVQVIEYRTLPEVFQALDNGDIDILITDEENAKYWVANTDQQFKLVGNPIPIGLGYGIMANKKSQDLINQVNKALTDMESDGTYLKIYQRYFTPMS
ncbi:transporter substrate-binding domain-containing protein [Legionella hackeliae]|uniref:Putative arginine 3rd transport system periplasmic binding protein n=1 Tax=Legionella hackeliae TaxID=449 RepID=A0A0A8UTW1_LEGHA|nr:transporter substrate-binding domain-containing protein [Legionella hackeliae]KTD12709.1 arginine transport system periplasmic binding protein [Legionella hackeliae]CEK12128.1 putative arginine 3rd transport system periplasmic binding protein [Legionella hackeliae]STX48914.1 arginine transport system substrate-binding protein [Legionella hackeliae]